MAEVRGAGTQVEASTRLRHVRAILTVVVAAAGGGLALALARGITAGEVPALLAFTLAYTLIAQTVVRLPSGTRFSSAAIIMAAAATGFGPKVALLVLPAYLVRFWLDRDWSWRLPYTCGQVALSVEAASAAFLLAGGRVGHLTGPLGALAALAFIVAYDVVNIGFAAGRLTLQTGEPWLPTAFRVLTRDRGTAQWLYYLLAVASSLLWSEDGSVGLVLIASLGFFLYSTLRQADVAARRAEEARTDTLTGLGNRRRLLEWAAGGLPEACGLLVLDLDHFKSINDRDGHDAGDAALVAAAQVLREQTRAEDVLIRWGGDEFLVALPGASAREAGKAARRIGQALASRSLIAGGHTVTLRASIGVAAAPTHGHDLAELLARADGAMYRSKPRAGRGTGSA